MEVLLSYPGGAETITIPAQMHTDLAVRYGLAYLKDPWAMVEIMVHELRRVNEQMNDVVEASEAA